jgi:hypothetical protein
MSSIPPNERFPLDQLDSIENVTKNLDKYFDKTIQKTIVLIPSLIESLSKLDKQRQTLVEHTDSVKKWSLKINIDVETYRYFLSQWGEFVIQVVKVRKCYANIMRQLDSYPNSTEVLQCKMYDFQSNYNDSLSHSWLGFNQRHENEIRAPQTKGIFSIFGKSMTLDLQRASRHVPFINDSPKEIEIKLLELYEKLIKEKNIQIDLSDDEEYSDDLTSDLTSYERRSSRDSVTSDQALQEEFQNDRGNDFNEVYYKPVNPTSCERRSSLGSVASDQAPQDQDRDGEEEFTGMFDPKRKASDDGSIYGPIEIVHSSNDDS